MASTECPLPVSSEGFEQASTQFITLTTLQKVAAYTQTIQQMQDFLSHYQVDEIGIMSTLR